MPTFSASVIGTSHIRAGLPCQDANALAALPNGVRLFALADGAGSAPRSDEGAKLIAGAAIAALNAVLAWQDAARTDWATTFPTIFEAALGGLRAYAGMMQADTNAFAGTLLCGVVWDGGLAAAQVGDGALVVRGADGALAVALAPDNGEYANETVFLTTSGALGRLQIFDGSDRSFSGVCAMSDGLTRLALQWPHLAPHANFFNPLFAFAQDPSATNAGLEEFLASPRVCARTDDDKTIILCINQEIKNEK
jgi:hypothetical protein